MELSQSGVNSCVGYGLSVIQGDADRDLESATAAERDLEDSVRDLEAQLAGLRQRLAEARRRSYRAESRQQRAAGQLSRLKE